MLPFSVQNFISAAFTAPNQPLPKPVEGDGQFRTTMVLCAMILLAFVGGQVASLVWEKRKEAEAMRKIKQSAVAWGWPMAMAQEAQEESAKAVRDALTEWRDAVAGAGGLMTDRTWALPCAESLTKPPNVAQPWLLECLHTVCQNSGVEQTVLDAASTTGASALAVTGGSGVFVTLHPVSMQKFLLGVMAKYAGAQVPTTGTVVLGGCPELTRAANRACACLLVAAARNAVQRGQEGDTVLMQTALRVSPTPEVILQAASRCATPPQGPGIVRPGTPDSASASVDVAVDLDALKDRVTASLNEAFGEGWPAYMSAGHFLPVQAPNGCVLRAFTHWPSGRKSLVSDDDPAGMSADEIRATMDAAECVREAARRRREMRGSDSDSSRESSRHSSPSSPQTLSC